MARITAAGVFGKKYGYNPDGTINGNFIAPDAIAYGFSKGLGAGTFAWEMACGGGITPGSAVVGVTVIVLGAQDDATCDLSKSFHTSSGRWGASLMAAQRKAEDYLREIGAKL